MPKLNVEYFAQNNNAYWDGASGYVQCAPTSYAALAYYLAPDKFPKDSFSEPECYYKQQFETMGYTAKDRGNHQAHVETLSSCFGITGRFTVSATLGDIKTSIDKGKPVVLPLVYKVAGHVTLCIGYNLKGLYLNDPYGIRAGSSNSYYAINDGSTKDGQADLYSWRTLNQVCFDSGECWAYIPD